MNKFALSALAIALVSSTAALAADPYFTTSTPYAAPASAADAFFALGVGYNWNSANLFDAGTLNGITGEVRGTMSYQFDGGFGVQGDLLANTRRLDIKEDGVNNPDFSDYDGALHAFYRDNQFLVGAFGQLGRTYFNSGTGMSLGLDRSYLGVEGQYYIDNITLAAQLGYNNVSFANNDIGGLFATAEARYFYDDNTRLTANLGYTNQGKKDIEVDVNTWDVGLSVEHKFEQSPFSAYASVNYQNADFNSGGESNAVENTSVKVGFKLNMDDRSLFDRDRNGASLNPVKPAGVGTFPIF